MNAALASIVAQIESELQAPVAPGVRAMADAIVARHGDSVAAILFYGSCLRDQTTDGILDFYVLVDDYRGYHRTRRQAVFNRLLPPSVALWSLGEGGTKAKVAVIARDQFARRMRPTSLDTSLWARFCQPAVLVHARDRECADWTASTLARAVVTAAGWAARLGPATGTPADYWTALFQRSYGAELRAESGEHRAKALYAAAAERFDCLLPPALEAAGIAASCASDGRLHLPPGAPRGRRRWWLRRAAGKTLNLVRLVKAAFTFAGGADYILWKIERHTGRRVRLTAWQRRHPLLAAPLVLWRLRSGRTAR